MRVTHGLQQPIIVTLPPVIQRLRYSTGTSSSPVRVRYSMLMIRPTRPCRR